MNYTIDKTNPQTKLISKTIDLTQPYSEEKITNSDAVEIIECVRNYSKALISIYDDLRENDENKRN